MLASYPKGGCGQAHFDPSCLCTASLAFAAKCCFPSGVLPLMSICALFK